MTSIETKDAVVHFNNKVYLALNDFLKDCLTSKIFVIVDENTHVDCLPDFLSKIETDIAIEVIEIPEGELHKTIETCIGVWNALSELDADRKSLIINLGGGVVTDLGGFVACTYKRGIEYINVPTSLLAMVDASVGGKTGVDLGSLKNQIGVISEPKMVLIDTEFLNTLPQNHMKSGLAEMLKHGLIRDEAYWDKLSSLEQLSIEDLDQLIYDSVVIKNNVVTEDPTEQGLRKILNFGHTLGHAIESYFLDAKDKAALLHGEAIAIGMILETHLSTKYCGFSKDDLNTISATFLKTFKKVTIENKDFDPIVDLMKYDKKNSHGKVKFVLLNNIGNPEVDCEVSNSDIFEAFKYYNAL
ncbi:3-dehydroquinate synthase [Winogradskyella sp. A3E31]|uniref:3-dehydroquinate synthase n=1 Tax=Winogradskyella sp. A3E31 TaxID=3349637 RepID=UPI00398ABAEB